MDQQKRKDILACLCAEVSYMHDHDKKRLQDAWRHRYGYVEALASILELALELAAERHLF